MRTIKLRCPEVPRFRGELSILNLKTEYRSIKEDPVQGLLQTLFA